MIECSLCVAIPMLVIVLLVGVAAMTANTNPRSA